MKPILKKLVHYLLLFIVVLIFYKFFYFLIEKFTSKEVNGSATFVTLVATQEITELLADSLILL